MNSTDGVNQVPQLPSEPRQNSVRRSDLSKLPKTAEEYVAIENRLAAQRDKTAATPQLNSIFDQLRGQLPK